MTANEAKSGGSAATEPALGTKGGKQKNGVSHNYYSSDRAIPSHL
ncbi:MAG: hypothetical protein ACRC80_23655 [Waterburya sp.]